MRMPAGTTKKRLSRPRVLGIGVLLVLAVALLSLRGIAGFYTDYLWYQEVGLEAVWRDLLFAKALPAVIFTLGFFLVLLVNLSIVDRLSARHPPLGPLDEFVERYRGAVGRHTRKLRFAVAAFLALLGGGGLSARWEQLLLFRNAVPFGIADEQFGRDVGFYVFRLPFLKFVFQWAFTATIITLLLAIVAHYLSGGIRLQGPFQRVAPHVKAHLSVILGAIASLKAFGYSLQQYELTFSTRGAVVGATYTDVKAQLPALRLLVLISIAATVLFLVNIRLRGWVLPVLAVIMWAVISVVVGGIYPAAVQRFQVTPNELARERPYIERHLKATRRAMGIDRVATRPYQYTEELATNDVRENLETLERARLWDPGILANTYSELQSIRPQYRFGDVDIDRYMINGVLTQVALAPRELNLERIPSGTWQSRHLVYTHGYGVVASATDGVTIDGRPVFLANDIPPRSTAPALEIDQPAIYFGEGLSGYAFVNSRQKEFDFPDEPRDATTQYRGKGGIPISTTMRRAAFALRFGDLNPLISKQITPESRLLFVRDVRERVRKAAPFLRYDSDPYPVLLDGRLLWVVDAYTASDRYPYAQPIDLRDLPDGSDLKALPYNYVRSSVKATVDAYDGTLRFYVVELGASGPDPIVTAYRQAFPTLFREASEMPPGLRQHLRYPEDLFRAQTDLYASYHVSRADDFFNRSNQWVVSQDPGTGDLAFLGGSGGRESTAQGATGRRLRMEPSSMLMRLPKQPDQSFLLLRSFVPVSNDDRLTNLRAVMVGKADPDAYGSLEALVMPSGKQVFGPAQVDAAINNTVDVSRELTFLSAAGSRVIQGSLLLIPTGESILYIRPYYLKGEGGTQLPEFKFVSVVHNGKAAVDTSVRGALEKLFPELGPKSSGDETAPPPDESSKATEIPSGDVASLLREAQATYDRAQAALREGDLARYQREVDHIAELLRRARGTERPGEGPPSPGAASSGATSGGR